MKKFGLLLALSTLGYAAISQTLFTYGNTGVDKEEFLRAYNKNKAAVTDKEKALREYLDLYVRFKLKVRAAKDMHLDTLEQIRNDLAGFRSQIEEGYMNNEKAVNLLVDEAFSRSQEDVHVLHLFVAVDPALRPADTLKAYNAIRLAHESLKNTNADYHKVAQTVTASTFPVKGTDLGFITAFTFPYEYENIIYGLNPGETSKPYRAKNGWHVFKLVEKRKAIGTWKVAQILFSLPPGDTVQNMALLKEKANMVYDKLQAGGDFIALAKEYSNDKMTYGIGGEMPEFGTGKYDASFENQVLRLQKNGDISKPFATPFGYHIIKRLSHNPVATDPKEPAYNYLLKQKVTNDSRIALAKAAFLEDIVVKAGYKRNPAVKDADLYRYADSVVANPSNGVMNYPVSRKPVFSFDKRTVNGNEWLTFAKDFKAGELYNGESNAFIFKKFINHAGLLYYKEHLEEFSPEFRYQMEEFREGNILFEVMERNVWGGAAADNAGLQAHYAKNKATYLWPASADVLIFTCSNKAAALQARADLQAGKDWRKIAENAAATLQADSGRYELAQVPVSNPAKIVAGLISEPEVNVVDGAASFVKVIRLYDAGMQRSFEEARGLVINDYQTVLEDKWVETLKKKYPVKINEAVFNSLLR